MNEIKKWVMERHGYDKSFVHLDELIPDLVNSQKNIFEQCINLFTSGCIVLKEARIDDMLFELQIELISEMNEIILAPNNIDDIISSIDDLAVPQFNLVKISKQDYLPNQCVLEFYQSALTFKLKDQDSLGYHVNYNEYRSIDEKKENLPFSRWLILNWSPPERKVC